MLLLQVVNNPPTLFTEPNYHCGIGTTILSSVVDTYSYIVYTVSEKTSTAQTCQNNFMIGK